ncbi:MAG: hypothetical protein GWM90_07845, partial [Gemmatimonadetes bacterium]|nr:hypothetical protein [Gemmatimonadota bacterium]NIQ53782.1 hypothetical protein [Gemmatimonadota bacterium]NIU73948.1 hypothetical protein [Gammaproteobacteria bacterium]NIX44024.1 hypothetical protein [Gemmatimonadota bacterium]NIY08235.1 hypothetical protein [Gemmatimonadota bacterium]
PDRLGAPVRLRGVASTRMYETRKDLHYAVVQGDREGVRLVTSDADVLARVRPGTRVEATGVVATYRGAEELHLTDLRIVGHGLPPRPTTVLVAEALGESHSHLLVRIEGRLETVEVADGGLRHTLV